jgi:hypothetical protein
MTTLPQDLSCFEPDATAVLADAIDRTCLALQIPSTDRHCREVVAARIIDLARGGILDAEALQKRVVNEAKLRL